MRYLHAFFLFVLMPTSVCAGLVPEGAKPERVADGYQFTEGPALGPDGCIYFTDIPAEQILKFDPTTGKTSRYRKDTGRANGLMWFRGDLFMCCHGARALRYYPLSPRWYEQTEQFDHPFYNGKTPADDHPTQPVVILDHWHAPIDDEAEEPQAPERFLLNSPNDLAIDSTGQVYFTDPRYGNRDNMELQTEGVYTSLLFGRTIDEKWVKPNAKLIDGDLVRPNGIVLSPDESILYVADHGANWIYAYDIESPGNVKNKRKFAQLNDGEGRGSDGMCVDAKGRLYTTGHGKVWVFEPTGQLVATIPVGPQTTNVTFAADGKTLYITADKGLHRIRLNTDAPLQFAQDKADPEKPERITLKLIPLDSANMERGFLPHLQGIHVTHNDLHEKLVAMYEEQQDEIFVIELKHAIKYNMIIRYIEAAHKAGFEKIHLIAELAG